MFELFEVSGLFRARLIKLHYRKSDRKHHYRQMVRDLYSSQVRRLRRLDILSEAENQGAGLGGESLRTAVSSLFSVRRSPARYSPRPASLSRNACRPKFEPAVRGNLSSAALPIALRLPYTFVVLALLILIAGGLAAIRTPVHIFPEIRIPVISTIWKYTGLPPHSYPVGSSRRSERVLTTTVNDIEHIEGNSYAGVGIVKVFFQPGADIRTANAQVTAVAQTLLKQMPPGTAPPLIPEL